MHYVCVCIEPCCVKCDVISAPTTEPVRYTVNCYNLYILSLYIDLFVELTSTLFDRHLAVQLLFRSRRRLEPIFLTKVNIPDVWKTVHCKPMFYMISNFSLPELCLYAPLFS